MTSPYANLRKIDDPIPAVEPEDIKRLRIFCKQATLARANGNVWREDLQASFSPGTDVPAISSRNGMIEMLTAYKVLTPWQRGEDFDDAVFKIAATFPVREFRSRDYMIEGDELFGFDPNAFVQQLVSETGISDTGKTIPTTMDETCRVWGSGPIEFRNDSPERQAEHQARAVLWMIFKRFSPILDLTSSPNQESSANSAALFFADFLLDNIELVRKLEEEFKNRQFGYIDLLKELEQRAQNWSQYAPQRHSP